MIEQQTLAQAEAEAMAALGIEEKGAVVCQALIANRGRTVHAAGTLSIDRWNGEERVQFRIMDLAGTEPGAR